MSFKNLTAAVAAAASLLCAAQAQATTITFDDLAAGSTLASQYSALGVTFAASAFSGTGSSSSGEIWATNSDLTLVLATGSDVGSLGTPSLVSGNVLRSFAGYLGEDGDASFSATFSTAVTSVSIDVAGVGSTPSDTRLFVYDGSTLLGTVAATSTGQSTLSFAAASITSIVVAPGSYLDYVAVDNLVFVPVPEPQTYALMALGLGALAARRRLGAPQG